MIPDINDTARRVVRTIIQVAVGFTAFAGVYPFIINAIGLPTGSRVGLWLAASVTIVGLVAGSVARIMAIPAVNEFLDKFRLAGHSGVEEVKIAKVEPPTQTTVLRLTDTNGGEFTGEPAR